MGDESMITKISNTIRGLAADMVEKAQSGHPGMPLGTADIGAVLFTEILKHNPNDPSWPDRDRFVLSAGHGSALLYSLLHLTGYDLPLEELKRFRQFGSKTPGHPEYHVTPGVETTTGPLGQGIANAVGMALAERMLAARFNRPGFEIVDHYTYAIAGDGCMMEGVSAEASSLAGTLSLGKLIVLYDDNDISIEGSTDLAFIENVGQRYQSYGWQVLQIDGNDPAQISKALLAAKADLFKPKLIIAKTSIAKGSPLEGNCESHGAPLGKENLAALKKNLGLPEQEFCIPREVIDFFSNRRLEWKKEKDAWTDKFEAWSKQFPDLRREWDRLMHGELPEQLESVFAGYEAKASATRESGGVVLNILASKVPELVGGSADLAPSNKTYLNGFNDVKAADFSGRNLHFGVREHAMGAILNGLSLHGGFRVFGSTFLVFSDYMRPAIRLAALMELPVVFVFTHDSFWVGEDGPTHQPIEHVEALRLIPNLQVIRPADANETAWAWLAAVQSKHQPTALILTRQKLPVLSGATQAGFARGGYIVKDVEAAKPDLIVVASGSEVPLGLETADLLAKDGKKARVVSVPCREKFLAQDASYRSQILPPGIPVVAMEAGIGSGWRQLTSGPENGLVISIERFGQSAPAKDLTKEFGFTAEAATTKIKQHFKW
jgi:transketolase